MSLRLTLDTAFIYALYFFQIKCLQPRRHGFVGPNTSTSSVSYKILSGSKEKIQKGIEK